MFETPEDFYQAYEKAVRKREYKRAYRLLEKMLHLFPDDRELLQQIIELCVHTWKKPELGRKWLAQFAALTGRWTDYTYLAHIETELGLLDKARKSLARARQLQPQQPGVRGLGPPAETLAALEFFIKQKEWVLSQSGSDRAPIGAAPVRERRASRRAGEQRPVRSPAPKPVGVAPAGVAAGRAPTPSPPAVVNVQALPHYRVPLKFAADQESRAAFEAIAAAPPVSLAAARLKIAYARVAMQGSYDELVALPTLVGIDHYWYQLATARKVLKQFHGRVLLADEVGLGKTIEAGILIKEYLMRGMVRNVLILTPASLVTQWQEEMRTKFGLEFATTEDAAAPAEFWRRPLIIASLARAKSSRNCELVAEQFYDLVVVDEAHHLRNRTTRAWQLVNRLKKKFIFLLTATPVHNQLLELFNLITLLKPGQFQTERLFKREYVKRGNPRAPLNRDKLRELLREVMIRNTRSAIDLKLPRRYAATVRVAPTAAEKEIYDRVNAWLRRAGTSAATAHLLLREAGSSPFALRDYFARRSDDPEAGEIAARVAAMDECAKGKALLELVRRQPEEKKIVFTQFVASQEYLAGLLERNHLAYERFSGELTARQKDDAIARFRDRTPLLLSTESGGEGRNLQFCNTLINFDLPWNPMRIEQRIGRLHRIGQTRDVFIHNLSVRDTLEDQILELLESKINMFELVIGEIEPILGYISEDQEFDEIVLSLWTKSANPEELKAGFDRLGTELVAAKEQYLVARQLDRELLVEDYEV